jgi:hypothetical protein
MPKVGDAVEVEWLDAVCDNDEKRMEEMSEPAKVKTVGVLLALTAEYVRVACEVLDHGRGDITYRSTTTIPLATNVKVRRKA